MQMENFNGRKSCELGWMWERKRNDWIRIHNTYRNKFGNEMKTILRMVNEWGEDFDAQINCMNPFTSDEHKSIRFSFLDFLDSLSFKSFLLWIIQHTWLAIINQFQALTTKFYKATD